MDSLCTLWSHNAMPPPITLTSPLPPADLFFQSLSVSQGMSALEEMELELLSERSDLAAEDLLGKPIGVAIDLRDGTKRHVNGIVMRLGVGKPQGRHYGYRASVRPWLWFLTRTSDCRIFQEMTVPAIVEQVFGDHSAIASFEFKLDRSYRTRNYCVQYRETDFNFIARLLEEEGIFWFFQHKEGEHKLILVDDLSALSPSEGYEKLPHYDNAGQAPPDIDYITGWSFSREVQTGKIALTSYDFERPSVSLAVDASLVREHGLAEYEYFDYQGEYIVKGDGQQLADNRIDESQARHERLAGNTNAHGLAVGHTFSLFRHPREDQNAKYLCAQTQITASLNGSESGGGSGDFKCSFAAAPASHAFRPQRRTPKPFVQGPQTAVVVGPGGDEIFTDKYGRVKVQFHWDRYGKKNEKSSCWVRVSSPWAGKSFGFVQVPRIGQEVVVDFLEGDPDQPIITGRVYNAEQMPPWDLPANATQSGVLTRSSKGGAYSNANALRFEDKKGSEQLWLHAEKNQDIEVENDETHWVGHDRTKTIDHDETVHVKHDRTETVDNDETITIHHDRKERVDHDEAIDIGRDRSMKIGRDKTESVGRNKVIDIGANQSETIASAMSLTVGGSLSESVGTNHSETVGGAMEITVGLAMAITVGAALAETVGGVKSENIGAAKSEVVGGNSTLGVGGDRSVTVAKNMSITVTKDRKVSVAGQQVVKVTKEHILNAKKIQFVAEDEISLKCGDAEITMKKNGDITIKGGKINVKGSGDVVVKGSKILEN